MASAQGHHVPVNTSEGRGAPLNVPKTHTSRNARMRSSSPTETQNFTTFQGGPRAPTFRANGKNRDAGESGRKGLEGGEGKEEQQGEYAEEVLSQT